MYVLLSDVTDLLYEHGESGDDEYLLNQLLKEVNDLPTIKELESTHWVVTKNGWMHCERCGETFRAGRSTMHWQFCPCCGKFVAGRKEEKA